MTATNDLFSSGFIGCIHEMMVVKYSGDSSKTGEIRHGGIVEFNNPLITEEIVGVTCEKMCAVY